MIEAMFALVILILCGTLLALQVLHHREVQKLTEKIMAKNYGEYVQGEVYKQPPVKAEKTNATDEAALEKENNEVLSELNKMVGLV